MSKSELTFGVFDRYGLEAQPGSSDSVVVGWLGKFTANRKTSIIGPTENKEAVVKELYRYEILSGARNLAKTRSPADLPKVWKWLIGKPISCIYAYGEYFYLWVDNMIELYFERNGYLESIPAGSTVSWGNTPKKLVSVEGTVLGFEDGTTIDLIDVRCMSDVY